MKKFLSKRISLFLTTLVGLLLVCVTNVYAGTAYTNGRAFLKQGSPTGGGKVYVASNATEPTSGKYKAVTSSTSPAFNVQVEGNATFHYWAVANPGYIFTGWYDANGTLQSSGAAHFSKAVTAGQAGASDTHAYADYYASFIKQIQLSFVVPTNGSFTITHKGSEVTPAYSSFTTEGKVVLTALPADGYKLRGWYTTTNGGATKNYFAFGTTCEPNFTGNTTIGAEFVPDDGKATFWIKGTNFIYDNLTDANTKAASVSSKMIVVVSDGIVGAGTYTISSGVTLLIPYEETYNLMTTPNIKHIEVPNATHKRTSIFRKLTLASGATINVSGNICIGGSIASCNGGSPSSFPTGSVGVLDLSRGGTINLASGSNLYAWGYVKGQDMDQGNNTTESGVGQINAASGATVWEDYQVGEWRGGTASSTIYNNKSSWKFFPFQSYSVQNIEAPVTYAYGSNCKCYWTIFGNGEVYKVDFPLIAASGSLFKLANTSGTSVKKWYDPTTDHVCFELAGNAALDALTLSVMGETVTSSDYYLPIPANLKISLKSGNSLTVSKPMTVHAGAVIEVKTGATLNVNSKVFLYDADDWDMYCMYKYYYRTYYSPSIHFDRGEGTSKTNLEDATVIVDGTVNVGAQNLYATAHGANICGNGGGTFVYNTLPGNTTMTQCKELKDNVSVNIRSANLHNENDSYTKGIASTTFKNVNGRWFTNAKSTEKSNHTYDFTYIKSGDVYGTGGTNATVAACYSKDKTGLKLQDKWANIQAEGCTNWWEGIDNSHLYNWSLNSAWHQYIMTGSTTTEIDDEEVTTETYAGSDGRLFYKTDCTIEEDGTIDGNCLYTIGGVKKALVNGSFVAVTANTSPDHGYHDASTNYYLCFDGCVWHPATRNAENLYTVSGTKYIWYGDKWMAVQYDSGVSLYYSLSSTNVKIYYEYVGSAWVLATPVAEVETSAGTEQVFSLANAITKAKTGGTNVTIRLMKNLSGTFTYDGENNCGLDLNGFTFSSTTTSMIKVNNSKATIIIKDQSSSGKGKIQATYSRSDDKVYGLNVTNGHIVLNSGTVHIENTHASQGACGVYVVSGMKFTMNGGTLEVVSKGASWGVYTLSSTTSTVIINGGTIDASTTSASGDNTTCAIYGLGGDITVNGGTLNGKASATYARGIYLNSASPKLIVNSGTITATAPNTIYGLHLIAGATATVNGGTITATATGGTVRGILSYGTLTMNGGTVNANAGGSDSRALFLRNNTSTIKAGVSATATATTNAYGIYYDNATPTVTVDGGSFNVSTTSTTGAYGVYAAKGTATINDGTFTVTAKTTGAEGLHVESTNTPKLTVNGGKFMVKNSDGAANGVVNNTAAAAANFSLAGGYYNLAPAGSYVASGKDVYDVERAKEQAIYDAGYVKKVRGNEYTVTWYNYNGTTLLGTTQVESGKVPVWTGATPTYNTTTTTREFDGWSTEAKNKGTTYLDGAALPAIGAANVTYYAHYDVIYAEVTIGTTTTRYTSANSAWTAAMGAQRATIRLLTNIGTEASIGNKTQMVFSPTNANSIITLDLNGHSWTMGTHKTDGVLDAYNTSPFLQVNKAGCKLIITDNSASGNGYLMNSWAKTDGDLRCVEVNAGELVLQKGGIRVKNTDADHYSHAVVVSGNNAHFTMTDGTVYATDAQSPRGVNVANGYADIAGGTVEAKSTAGEAYALLCYDTVNVSADAVIKATGTDGSAYGLYCNGASALLTVDSCNVEAKGTGWVHAIYALGAGTVVVDGKPNISSTTTTSSGAFGVYATGTNTNVTVNSGTFTVKAATTAPRGINTSSTGTVTVKGGSFTVTSDLDGDPSAFGAYAESGTVNIEGGNFTLNVLQASMNADLVRCGPSATAYLNVSGGTFTSEKAFYGVRSFGGETTVTGNPVFTAHRGIGAGEWASATGTAKVTIDGGTYNCTVGYALLSKTHTHGTTGDVVTGDVTVLDGKFHTLSSVQPIDASQSADYLKIKGGYFTSYTSSNVSNLNKYVVAPSTTVAVESTDPMYASPNDYRYRVNTKFTVTWKDGDKTLKTQEYNRNEMPSYDYNPTTSAETYVLTGWTPALAPVTADITYTAVKQKYEAEVFETGSASTRKYASITDAWADVQKIPNGTMRILSNCYKGITLTYNPAPEAGIEEGMPGYFTTATTTIDLNGHTYNCYLSTTNVYALEMKKAGCKLIITDNSGLTTGYFGHMNYDVPNCRYKGIKLEQGELVLAGGTLRSQCTYPYLADDSETFSASGAYTVDVYAGATFTMTGGTLYAEAHQDARAVNFSGNGVVNISGGVIKALAQFKKKDDATQYYGGSAYGVVSDNKGGTINISGTTNMTIKANTGAWGVHVNGSSNAVRANISGGTIDCWAKTSAARPVNCTDANAVMNISGGSFKANSSVDASAWNTETVCVHKGAIVNISGGTYESSTGANCNAVRNFGGTVTITGNPLFKTRNGINAGDYAENTATATVYVNGGTFNTKGYCFYANTNTRESYTVTGKVYVNAGYFNSYGGSICSGTAGTNLVLHGGYYKERSGTSTKTNITTYKGATTEVSTLSPAITVNDTTYHYELLTDFDITWLAGDSYSKVTTLKSGTMPTNTDFDGTYFLRNDSAFYFTGWSPTPTAVTADATYNALGVYQAAKVTVEAQDSIFDDFDEAWAYAMAQQEATITLLSNIARTSHILYKPGSADARHTLDLNNFTISNAGTDVYILRLKRVGAQLTITDNSTEKGGKIQNHVDYAGTSYAIAISSGDLVIAGGEISVRNGTSSKAAYGVNVGIDGSTFTMTGGTLKACSYKARAINTSKACTINISGGHIIATTELTEDTWLYYAYGLYISGAATITVSGTAVIDADANKYAYGIVAGSTSNTTISGGTVNATTHGSSVADCCSASSSAVMTINGGIFNATSYSSDAYGARVGGSATMNINGGTFTSVASASRGCGVYSLGGTTTINGNPIFTAKLGVMVGHTCDDTGNEQWTATVNINGGTFDASQYALYAYWDDGEAGNVVSSDITVNGGYFKSAGDNIAAKRANGTGTASITINGGYFNEKSETTYKTQINKYVTSPREVYTIDASDPNYPEYSYCVTNGHPVASVQVGSIITHYTTAKAALDYAKTQNNSITTILEDCDFETEEQWGYGLCPTGKTMTIDLNNHTLDATNMVASYDRVFGISGQLTITDNSESKGGKLSLTKNHDGSFIGIVINSAGKLTLADGTVYVENEHATKGVCGVNVWGTGGNFTQTGGLLEVKANGSANGLTHRQSVTLSGGEIRVTSVNSSATGDAPSSNTSEGLYGSTTVSDTAYINVTAKNDARAFTCTAAGTTTTISGGTFKATATNGTSARCIHANVANTITVSGGKFFADGDKIVDVTSATLTITGGYFNEKSGTTYKDQIDDYVTSPYEIYAIEASDPNYPDYSYCVTNGHPVASVQTGAIVTHYTTIKAALDYAKTVADPTITLLDDCSLTEANYMINPAGTWTGTLDLNNFTLTPTIHAENGRAFTIGGTGTKFIVTDNSVGQGGQIYYKGNSSVSIIYFVVAGGEMELAGGTLYVENTNAEKKAIGFVVDGNPSQFTQSGGTFTIKGAYGANGYYGRGTATFTGGTMNVDGGAHQAIGLFPQESTSVLNVSGSFALNVTSSLADSYGVLVKNSGATGTINGGKFKFNQNTMVGAQLDASLTINGGYFCEHPSEAGRYKSQINPLKGSGKEVVNLSAGDPEYEAGYRYIVTDADPVAKVTTGSTTTYYTTIDDAIEAANDMTNPTVTMLDDVTTTQLTITAAMTLDLNGKTIRSTQTTTKKGVFAINADGKTITIQDSGSGGKIEHEATVNGYLYGIYLIAGSLNMTGGTIYAKNEVTTESSSYRAYGIYTPESATTSSITISGGTIEAYSPNTQRPLGILAYGNLTMTGGTVIADGLFYARGIYAHGATTSLTDVTVTTNSTDSISYAVQAAAGNVVINSGTYTATAGNKYAYAIYDAASTLTVNNGTFTANGETTVYTVYKTAGTLTINNGSFTADGEESLVYSIYDYTGTVTINNGTYTSTGTTINTRNSSKVNLTVNDGKFSGATKELNKGTSSTVSIRGGYYVHNTTVKDWLAENHYIFSESLTEGGITYNYRVAEKYTLAWSTDGDALTGTYTSGLTEVGTTITAPNTPTKTGYTFAAWDPAFTGTMPAANTTYTATWTPNTNTAYTVEHYKQNLAGDGYDLADTDNLTGTTATSVTPAVKSYEGFTAPSTQTVTILADGSRVVTYNYTRNSYTLAWTLDGGSIETPGTTAGTVKYGASLTAPTVAKSGYVFNAWSPSVPATMPAANATYTATWTAAEASVTESGVTTDYETFGEAWNAANSATAASTIKLLKAATVTTQLTYDNENDQNCTLDLNGHTITSETNVQRPLYINNADVTFTITDSSEVKAGKLSITTSYSGENFGANVYKGTLILEAGTIEVSSGSQTTCGVTVSSKATFTMNGGTIHVVTTNSKEGRGVYANGITTINAGSTIDVDAAGDAYGIYFYSSSSKTVTVNGGKFDITGSTAAKSYLCDTKLANTTVLLKGGWYTTKLMSDGNNIETKYVAPGKSCTYSIFDLADESPYLYEIAEATYTVTFDKEGGSEGDNSVAATYSTDMPTVTPPTRENYEFGGYWDGDNGTGTQYYNADGTSARTWDKTSNTTLYAKWTEAKVSVTINSGTPSYYATLAGAFNIAKDAATNATVVITVLKDITDITSQITYAPTKVFTTILDLNGHLVQGSVTTSNYQLIRFSPSSSARTAILEITDSGTGGKLHNEASLNNSLYCIYVDYGHLKISGGTVSVNNTLAYNSSTAKSVYAYAIYTRSNATASNVQITMTNGTVKAEGDYRVYALCPRCTANISGGKIEAEASTGYAYAIYTNSPSGSATTISGSVDASAEAPAYAGTVYSYGTTNVEGGTFTATATTGNYAYGVRVPRGTTTVTDSPEFTITAKQYAYGVYAGEKPTSDPTLNNGHAIIRGGTFMVSTTTPATSGYTYAYGVYANADGRTVSDVGHVSAGTIDVYDGTFDITAYSKVYGIYSKGTVTQLEASATPKVNIYGGKFKVTKGYTSSTTNWGAVCATSAEITNDDVVIEGGYFNTNANNYLDQYTAPTKDCDYVVMNTPTAVKAIIGTDYTYMVANENAVAIVTGDASESYQALTVADAIDAAEDMTNPTVLMLQDASTEEVEIKAAMTIDLNGKTISSTQTDNAKGVFKMNASGKTLTIRDSGTGGKIDHTATISGGSAVGIYVAAGSLRMESGIIYAKNPSTTNSSQAFGIATASGCGLTMTGGTVTAEAYKEARGLWLNGTTSLTDATVTSTSTNNISYAVQANAGALTVHSGTYTATGTTGYAVRERAGTVSIEGGKFSGSTQDFVKEGGTASISGGYYVHDTNIQDNCAANYYCVSNAEMPGYNYKVAEVANTGFYADIVDVDNTNLKLIVNVTSWAVNGWPYNINGVLYYKDKTTADAASSTLYREADRTLKIPYVGEPGENFAMKVQKTGGDLVSSHVYVIPQEITSNTTITANQTKSLYVKGATLTVDGSISAKNIYVAPDATLTINTGKTLTADSIFLRTTASSSAQMENNGTIAGSTKVLYTRIIKDKDFHFFGLPLSCAISAVRLSDGVIPHYNTGWFIRSYNENRRASNGANNENWDTESEERTITGGRGYEMYSASNYYREFYFPVNLSGLTNEVPLAFTADGAAGISNAGWNALVSPLTHTYENAQVPEGMVINWYRDGWYEQVIPTEIPAASAFVFQTDKAGVLSFAGDYIVNAAPRKVSDKDTRIQWLHLDVKDIRGEGDQTSVYSHPSRYEQAYKTGIDVAKQSFEASRALIYSSHRYGEMAFAGVADSLLEIGIPLTVYSPAAQELTISMRENDWLERLAYVWLIDHKEGIRTDLLWDSYTFDASEGTTAGRFTIQGVFYAPQITTGTETVSGAGREKARKLIIDDKMYIILNGLMYDATGKRVNK